MSLFALPRGRRGAAALGAVAGATVGLAACLLAGVPAAPRAAAAAAPAPAAVTRGGHATTSDSGYWLATADGNVFAGGPVRALGGTLTSGANPVVGIAATHDGNGYWLVEADGNVVPFGTASLHGTLPGMNVHVNDIVAMTPTGDDRGYWMIGSDGGEFAFGDAKYRGSLPGLGIHVHDIVGMVATADGRGYWIVGSDGGVFAFGDATYKGSLPGIHVHVDDVRAMIASPTREGYVLVGADGGAFVFGRGVAYYGSLPGRHIHVSDIVGLALTPGAGGYWMVGTNAATYAFGNAGTYGVPGGIGAHLPVVAIATAPATSGSLSYAAWQVQPTPTPGSASRLNGVRCVSADDCVSVGWDESGSVQSALVDTWNGSTWSPNVLHGPSSTVNQLSGVSCTSSTACMAVGFEDASNTQPQMLVERLVGTTWTAAEPTLPSGAQEVAAELTSVSCATATSCVAAGFFRNRGGLTLAFADSWNGNTDVWTPEQVPLPSGARLTQLLGVSCSNGSTCIAVGNYTNAANTEVTLAARGPASTWSLVPPISPGGAPASSLAAVSCLGNGVCTAVGDYAASGGSGTTALAEAWNGGSWSLQSTPSVRGAIVTTLGGVSCPGAGDCTATGLYSTTSATLAIAEQWNGSSWSLQSTPIPSGDHGAFLNAISCAVSAYCTAVGQQITGSNAHLALAEQWVQHIGTATSLSSGASPSVTGQPVNFTARVVPLQQGFGTPPGSVTFTVTNAAGAAVGCASGNTKGLSNGVATCTIGTGAMLAAQGPYNVKASYGGGSGPFGSFLASTATLNPPQPVDKDATTVTIRSSANPVVYGHTFDLTVIVAARLPGAGTPTGSVTISVNGRNLFCREGNDTFPLTGGQVTTCQLFFGAGSYSVVATYGGDPNFLGSSNSSSPFHQTVDKDGTSTTVVSSNSTDTGGTIDYTATVTADSSSQVPFGTVTFTATDQTSGTVYHLDCVPSTQPPTDVVTIAYDPNAQKYDAICQDPSSIPDGTYTITAVYSGNNDFFSSQGTTTETVSIT